MLLSGLTDATCTLLCASALASAYGVDKPCALNGPQFLADWTHVGEPVVVKGQVMLSDRPGHGAVLDEARIERESAALKL
jgi:L-alanine-DL-glutamate epimerase-like enolase superfamily enzyme